MTDRATDGGSYLGRPPPRSRRSRRAWLGLAALAGLVGWSAQAQPSAPVAPTASASTAPTTSTGKVVLTIEGPGDRHVDFDMMALERLAQHSFTTATPWYNGPRRFSGPLLRSVLAAAGVRGGMLHAISLNNYKIDLPAEDATRFDVIIATRIDGQPMTVREKGPLFIVYPFNTRAELRSERYYSRSAWQLRRIVLRP